MSTNYYNSYVRRAISDEYVKCAKKKHEYTNRLNEVLQKLAYEQDVLSYREYTRLLDKQKYLEKSIYEEDIRLSVWDQVRELCLNIADEMEDSK